MGDQLISVDLSELLIEFYESSPQFCEFSGLSPFFQASPTR